MAVYFKVRRFLPSFSHAYLRICVQFLLSFCCYFCCCLFAYVCMCFIHGDILFDFVFGSVFPPGSDGLLRLNCNC